MHLVTHKRGFTLIETIVYIALLSILISGSILITYQITQGTENVNTKTTTDEEAHFLLRKIDWTLSGITAINDPAAGSSGAGLSVDKINGPNPLVFDLDSGNVRLSRASGGFTILNSENVMVSGLLFEHIAPVGTKPAAVRVSFTLGGRQFEQTRYIRK